MKHKATKQGRSSRTKEKKKNLSGSALSKEGPKASNQMQVQLRCGIQVACFVPDYEEEEPQIGTVTATPVGSENVEIEWMMGSYSEPWTVCKKREKGKYVTWKEKIPLSSILFPIELTRSCRLNTGLVKKLKHAYKVIRETD